MRLIFAGTPEFAATSLRRLVSSGHHVVLVLTQPDRPSGRGLQPQPSAVKRVAIEHRIDVQQPQSLRDVALQQQLNAVAVDAWVVAAYGLILPGALLHGPGFGCLNVHASLLPRWRGAAPIQRAIMAGDRETGISIMQMDAGLDTGPVYRQRAISITDLDTAGSLHDRLALLGADMIAQVLEEIAHGRVDATPQPALGVTYAAKIDRRETSIDWALPAAVIERRLRAFDPTPGASTQIGGTNLKIWRGGLGPDHATAAPGTVVDAGPEGVVVCCGQGSIMLTELQRPGGRRLRAAEFLRGFPIRAGARFGS